MYHVALVWTLVVQRKAKITVLQVPTTFSPPDGTRKRHAPSGVTQRSHEAWEEHRQSVLGSHVVPSMQCDRTRHSRNPVEDDQSSQAACTR